jgi:hypothetical protein
MTWFREEMDSVDARQDNFETASARQDSELSRITGQLEQWPYDSLVWIYQEMRSINARLSRVEQATDSIKTWPSHVEGMIVETVYTPEDSAKVIVGDSVAISWTHNWLDITGKPERVCYFETSYTVEGIYFPLGRTAADAQTYRPPRWFVYHNLPVGKKIVLLVRAVDTSANRSTWHSSLNDGWYILRVR